MGEGNGQSRKLILAPGNSNIGGCDVGRGINERLEGNQRMEGGQSRQKPSLRGGTQGSTVLSD